MLFQLSYCPKGPECSPRISAGGGSRTPKLFRAPGPKPGLYASSSTPASVWIVGPAGIGPPMTEREDDFELSEEDLAAAEAGEIGGPGPEYEGDEEDRALEEGGEGEAEGFEQAEQELEEQASHGEPRYDPEVDEFPPEEESDLSGAEYGEADDAQPNDA
jgi:hypothetical protein